MRGILKRLIGRNSKSSSFRRLIQSAFSRLETLKNNRHGRYLQDRQDVLRLLKDGPLKLALPRCEQVIKHQNLSDVYDIIEGYLNLLMERIHLLRRERECPDELKEAVSSVVFAASRCKDFPELKEIKSILTSNFGAEFTARAVELRNNNVVNHSMMQKLSTEKPDMESTKSLLSVIASENGIPLQFNEQGEPSSPIQTRQQNKGVAASSYRTRSSSRRRRR